MIRRTFYFLLVTVLLGGLAAAIAFWSFYALPTMIARSIQSAPPPVQTVSAEEAKSENWQPEIAAIGTLTARKASNRPAGRRRGHGDLFESGASVKKGDKLVQLDTATDEADLQNLRVQLANAEEELDRKQKIFDSGFAAKADLDNCARRATSCWPALSAPRRRSPRNQSMRHGTASWACAAFRSATMWRRARRSSGCRRSIRSMPIST